MTNMGVMAVGQN